MYSANASIPVDSKWSIRRSCCLRRAALTKAVDCICLHFVSGSLHQRSFLNILLGCWHIMYMYMPALIVGRGCRTFAFPWSCIQLSFSPHQRQPCLRSMRSTLPQSQRVLIEHRQWMLKGCLIHDVIVLDCWVACTPCNNLCDKIHESLHSINFQQNSQWHPCTDTLPRATLPSCQP